MDNTKQSFTERAEELRTFNSLSQVWGALDTLRTHPYLDEAPNRGILLGQVDYLRNCTFTRDGLQQSIDCFLALI